MGYISHNAIVVTADAERIESIHAFVLELARERQFEHLVSAIVGPGVNGYCSFLVAPDGSKEWWSTSDEGDELRDLIVDRLETRAQEDRLWSQWVEVQYGNDDHITKVVRDSDHPDGNFDAD